MKNSEKAKVKASNIEKTTNKIIIGILCIQVTLCTVIAILNSIFNARNLKNHHYLF